MSIPSIDLDQLVSAIPLPSIILDLSKRTTMAVAVNLEAVKLFDLSGRPVAAAPIKATKLFPEMMGNPLFTDPLAATVRDGVIRSCQCTLEFSHQQHQHIEARFSRLHDDVAVVCFVIRTTEAHLKQQLDLQMAHMSFTGELTALLYSDEPLDSIIKVTCDRLKDIHHLAHTDLWLKESTSNGTLTRVRYSNIAGPITNAVQKLTGLTYHGLEVPIFPGSSFEPVYNHGVTITAEGDDVINIVADFVTPERTHLRKLAGQVARMAQSGFVLVIPLKGPSGVIGHMGFNAPTPLEETEILSLCLVVDKLGSIIEVKRAAEQKTELTNQLIQSQKMEAVGQLASGIAHDFNNLLTGILGNIQLAQYDLEPGSELYNLLGEVTDAAKRAARLIKQLLTYARQQQPQVKEVDLSLLLRTATSLWQRTVNENIHINLERFAKQTYVNADPAHLEQIFMNLMVNATDAMPAGGTLTIRLANTTLTDHEATRIGTSANTPLIVVEVSDSGIGMSEAVQEHIFEPFFTTKEKGKGTGLGLSMVYSLVEQMNGTITVTSRENQGTKFSIYLPVHEPTVHKVEERHSSAVPDSAVNQTILVVEDEAIVRLTTKRMMEALGYRVFTSSSGPEALKMIDDHNGTPQIDKHPLDLVVTDVMMPQMDGGTLARQLKTRFANLPVLFISGYPEETLSSHGADPTLGALLPKPYSTNQLATALRRLLSAPKS